MMMLHLDDAFRAARDLHMTQKEVMLTPTYDLKSALHKIIPVNSQIANIHVSPIPPWTLHTPTVLFDLSKHNVKSFTNADTFNSLYHEIRNQFVIYHSIFTDGSKITNKTAAATFFQNSNICISH